MAIRGFYINLDQSVDRRIQIEQQLTKLASVGAYERYPAVDGRRSSARPDVKRYRGAIGCYLSHHNLINRHDGGDWVHIIEDDALISQYCGSVISSISDVDAYSKFDIVFTNALLLADPAAFCNIKDLFDRCVSVDISGTVRSVSSFNAISLKSIPFRQTTSYLVNPKSAHKIASLLSKAFSDEQFQPIDVVYSNLSQSGEIDAACCVPFFTVPKLDSDSTISSGINLELATLLSIEHALFADRNMQDLRNYLRLLRRSEKASVTGEMIGDALQILLSQVWSGPAIP